MKNELWKQRTKLLIGESGAKALENSSVCVVGVGGVGGYVATLLARAGVGTFLFVDFDTVDETNINRQVVANVSTVGMPKVDVLKKQVLLINPQCRVSVFSGRFSQENAEKILSGQNFDYVVDCIDSVPDKVELICFCKTHSLPIVSAMGAGNRADIPKFEVKDIFKTQNDGLARAMRKRLRERGVADLDVVCSAQAASKPNSPEDLAQANTIGSISYQPAMCGCMLASFVVNRLLQASPEQNHRQ